MFLVDNENSSKTQGPEHPKQDNKTLKEATNGIMKLKDLWLTYILHCR